MAARRRAECTRREPSQVKGDVLCHTSTANLYLGTECKPLWRSAKTRADPPQRPNLDAADSRGTNLSGANLSGANLTGISGRTEQQVQTVATVDSDTKFGPLPE
ncbi:pentapeptide repeat-containing protein [Streptosporangium soli]